MELFIWRRSHLFLPVHLLPVNKILQHLLGGLSYLYKATGNQSYLDYTSNIMATAVTTFATTGVVEELCEATGMCNQDQQGFKV
jgi:hypothetical protein